tara:strand:- start:599 stop:832 length:234 start_codon:yes stop_codon:yes gene_type:complete
VQKCVIIESYNTEDLEWNSEEDYNLAKERHGKEPIYFIYERSWTKHKIYSNVPDLYRESGGYSIIRRERGADNAVYL